VILSDSDVGGRGPKQISIFAVVVLYKMEPADSRTVTTLLEAASHAEAASSLRLHVLLYDNTPGRTSADVPKGVSYFPSARNDGLANAYNYACTEAARLGFDWVLTLDQDTKLPKDFFTHSTRHLQEFQNTPEIAALVPQITSGERILSPYQFRLGGAKPVWLSRNYQGIPAQAVYAFNSGSILRLSAILQTGGYDPRFWLDQSDTSLFHRLWEFGKRVYVAGDIQVEHDFSMVSGNHRVSAERYKSILEAETAVGDLHFGPIASLACAARLLVRWFRYRQPADKPLQSLTGSMLKLHLLHSRKFRLQRWNLLRSTERYVPPPHRGLKLSVCMATHNGQQFVIPQVESILSQLGPADELIVMDDVSRDSTVALIESLQDPRIRIILQKQNQGVVKNFEQAIRNATGDIIFLSDQDDLWRDDKVEKTVNAFRQHPQASIVTTSFAMIAETGVPLDPEPGAEKPRAEKAPFATGFLINLLRNPYQGSTMAFRSSLLPNILPFPAGKIFFHDAWIGLQNEMRGGNVVFLEEPLLLYRRHSANLSGSTSRSKQLKARVQLASALLRSYLRRKLLFAGTFAPPHLPGD
jgi:GT2 family glycosyltransferase